MNILNQVPADLGLLLLTWFNFNAGMNKACDGIIKRVMELFLHS